MWEAEEIFQDAGSAIFEMLWQWARKRHNNKPRRWVKDKYFHAHEGRNWVFSGVVIGRGGVLETVRLFRAAQTSIKRHIKIRGEANPFDPSWEVYAREAPGRENGKHPQGKKTGACPLEKPAWTLSSLSPKDYQTDGVAQPPQSVAIQRGRRSTRQSGAAASNLPSTTP